MALPRPDSSALVLRTNSVLIDLRQPADFAQWHLPSAVNVPLSSLTASTPNPFSDPSTLKEEWCELEALTEGDKEMAAQLEPISNSSGQGPLTPSTLHNRNVTLHCYNGDTARVATSVLRAREIDAYSIKGGVRAILREMPQFVDRKGEGEKHNDLGLTNLSLATVNRQCII